MSPTIVALDQAMSALIASLGDHPVTRGVSGTDAIMDHCDYQDNPNHTTAHTMVRSAEEFLDDLSISRIDTPESRVAQSALESHLRAQ